MDRLRLSLCLAVLMTTSMPASASSSVWADSEGGRVRLVTTGIPDASGQLTGALHIELKPGWKTYWRDPGASGVPPQIDVTKAINVAKAELSYPAPGRHDDGYGGWAGYDHTVALPIKFTLAKPQENAVIDAGVFLGICQTICIPLQAQLKVDPAEDAGNAEDAQLVQAALASLPQKSTDAFGAKTLSGEKDKLVVEATAPAEAKSIDLFVAGEQGYLFGAPTRAEQDGKVVFSIPILGRPGKAAEGHGLPYTLTTSSGAVEGLLPYP
ncbi:protein-disulfide reductase DsbD domain-containing protein [Mesorhizobium sp. 1M-11]|uniref:protein-disulfide reductase DsbD domain-containing protein n=1 Tax=Mesorhizobium sp. 1M-11 TaxID=1529006 RepID=UPI0006C76791|nr:protein-disulfide reductase DsbD domain-containing protein [Mesorhizobium sp. 1M-11]